MRRRDAAGRGRRPTEAWLRGRADRRAEQRGPSSVPAARCQPAEQGVRAGSASCKRLHWAWRARRASVHRMSGPPGLLQHAEATGAVLGHVQAATGVQNNAGGLGFAHPHEGLLSGRGALARQLTTLVCFRWERRDLGTGSYLELVQRLCHPTPNLPRPSPYSFVSALTRRLRSLSSNTGRPEPVSLLSRILTHPAPRMQVHVAVFAAWPPMSALFSHLR